MAAPQEILPVTKVYKAMGLTITLFICHGNGLIHSSHGSWQLLQEKLKLLGEIIYMD